MRINCRDHRRSASNGRTLADCTLTRMRNILDRVRGAARGTVCVAVLTGLCLAGGSLSCLRAQAPDPSMTRPGEPTSIALALPEDRGQNALEQALRRLNTTASVMMIVAHPDDEDGALLTYLSRGLGARATLLTLTRGEGGQNAMTADTYDALGVMRTNELLAADAYYGAKQLWGTEADFGFSKTQEESFARWGHDRVLFDAVLAVRRERPQVIVATFVGAVSDGHGQHQVSGEIAQEVFKAAGDPKVFPEQLKDGIEPWQPLAVYSMTPFAPITDKGMFDYATGKWAPAAFKNYVTGEVVHGALTADATMPVGDRDAVLGRSYVQIARQGWGEQKSQNGGANPTLSGPASTSYHLWAVADEAKSKGGGNANGGLFHNGKVDIDTRLEGLAHLAGRNAPTWLTDGLAKVGAGLRDLIKARDGQPSMETAHTLAGLYKQTLDLRDRVASDRSLTSATKAGLQLELDAKSEEFQAALRELLGLDVTAVRTKESTVQSGGPRGGSAEETARSVAPGEEFRVRVHASQAYSPEAHLAGVRLVSQSGDAWQTERLGGEPPLAAGVTDVLFKVKVATNAQATRPFFTRPTIEQPYYDISNGAWRERSFAPWPLAAEVEFTFDGVPVRISEVVQTMNRVTGQGGIYQPLVVTPEVGVSVTPEARILPLNGGSLPVKVTVHTQGAAEGTVSLRLPEGWRADPAEAHFKRGSEGDTEPMQFSVDPDGVKPGKAYAVQAVAQAAGKSYSSGWRSIGYPGLRPYNLYDDAELKTRKVDVKLDAGLRIGYVMGPGDLVPEAIEAMGPVPHLLSADEVAGADLSAYDVIVIGIRAYSTRPELTTAQPRLDAFVRNGGTLVVQYQSANFPAPLPLALGRIPDRVVDEQAPVELLDASAPLLQSPNRITPEDFNGWVEERGHSFMESWDPGYTPLTETADAGQDPQRGGLLVTHPGKGTYVYVAYALYRQLPELVPGAYRILANLLSAGTAGKGPMTQR
ncbi:PIG-L family deacetylase [Acidobacteria bacterium AB60]|nr:PIG-L family deacetylase [Acidobacteria bacterium AB60]